MTQCNPSLFIRLPKFPGGKWRETDIIDVIDSLDYGVIEDVSVNSNVQGEQYAIVHFERWFRGAEDVANDISRGTRLTIPALYGKSFILNTYIQKQPNTYVRDPRMSNYKREQAKLSRSRASPKITNLSYVQTSLPAVYVQTIAGKLPIAPTLSFNSPTVERQQEEGEIEEHYRTEVIETELVERESTKS